jgi:hypothetical protein
VGAAIVLRLLASPFSMFAVVVADRREPNVRVPGVEYIIGDEVDVFNPRYMRELIARLQPMAIFDAVNTASITSRKGNILGAIDNFGWKVIRPAVSAGIIWIDIGTVGTGGMGITIPYTHSEPTTNGDIAPGLRRKIAASAAHQGLLQALGRTPGFKVGRVVPCAMIGSETPAYGTIELGKPKYPGPLLRVSGSFTSITNPEPIRFQVNGPYQGVYARMGENGPFGTDESVAITAIGQMEMVSAGRVADAALRMLGILFGSNGGTYVHEDLHPDPTSFAERNWAIKRMKELCDGHQMRSVAYGNLGAFLTRDLWELEALRLFEFTPRTLAAGISPNIKIDPHGTIGNNFAVALPSLGYPIASDDWFCPAREGTEEELSADQVWDQIRRIDLPPKHKQRLWCVDLRDRNLQRWVKAARGIVEADPQVFARSHLPPSLDKTIEPGSFWAMHMTVTGHCRGPYTQASRYL